MPKSVSLVRILENLSGLRQSHHTRRNIDLDAKQVIGLLRIFGLFDDLTYVNADAIRHRRTSLLRQRVIPPLQQERELERVGRRGEDEKKRTAGSADSFSLREPSRELAYQRMMLLD